MKFNKNFTVFFKIDTFRYKAGSMTVSTHLHVTCMRVWHITDRCAPACADCDRPPSVPLRTYLHELFRVPARATYGQLWELFSIAGWDTRVGDKPHRYMLSHRLRAKSVCNSTRVYAAVRPFREHHLDPIRPLFTVRAHSEKWDAPRPSPPTYATLPTHQPVPLPAPSSATGTIVRHCARA